MPIGIDPGLRGAGAVLDHAGVLMALHDTPVLTLARLEAYVRNTTCPAWLPSSCPRLSDSIRTKIYTSAFGLLDSLVGNVWGSSFRADLGGSNGLEWHGERTKLQPITH